MHDTDSTIKFENYLFALSRFSLVRLRTTPPPVACQIPLSMRFSRQEYWSGLPLSSPGDLPNPGIEPGTPALQANALPTEPLGKFKKLKEA